MYPPEPRALSILHIYIYPGARIDSFRSLARRARHKLHTGGGGRPRSYRPVLLSRPIGRPGTLVKLCALSLSRSIPRRGRRASLTDNPPIFPYYWPEQIMPRASTRCNYTAIFRHTRACAPRDIFVIRVCSPSVSRTFDFPRVAKMERDEKFARSPVYLSDLFDAHPGRLYGECESSLYLFAFILSLVVVPILVKSREC